MKFFRIINKFFTYLFFLLKFRHSKLAFLFSHYNLPLKTTERVRTVGNEIEFVDTKNRIPIKNAFVYKDELRSLINVLNYEGVKVAGVPDDQKIILDVNGVKVSSSSISNIFTAYEIYLEKLYDFSTPSVENIIVDIGMNVGFASLFFASSDKTTHVYSFEPFPSTYSEAMENISQNPSLSKKITPSNIGISDSSKTLEVPMMESGSAIASTSELFVQHNKVVSDKTIVVKVRGILEVLKDITEQHPGKKIYLKVDCEGEEYAIMQCLNQSNYMEKIAGFFIEWHIKGPDPIIEVLNRHDFTTLHVPRVGIDSGMIYSFK